MDDESNKINIKKVNDTKVFQLIGQGNTAEIYQYSENKVLKLFRDNMPITPVEKEFKISSIIQDQLLNVPKVYDMIEYKNRYGILYEQISGQEMLQLYKHNIFHLNQYTKIFASIHVSLHKKDINVSTTVKEKLSHDINSVTELTNDEKNTIINYLNELPDQNKLCHFDFHPGNIIFRNHCPIIIDWMTGCTGDPSADVARTILLMRTGEMMHINLIARVFLHLVMKRMGTEYFKEYQRLTDVSAEEIYRWMLPVAAARLAEWMTDHERKRLLVLVRKELAKLQ